MSINIHYYLESDVNIPITHYSEDSGLFVYLTLTKKNGSKDLQGNFRTTSAGGITRQRMLQQNQLEGVFEYGLVLGEHEINQIGIYTGYIEVRTNNLHEENKIVEIINVTLSVIPTLLDLETNFFTSEGQKQLTYAEMISTLYNFLYISPRFQTLDCNGELAVTYTNYGFKRKVVLFTDQNQTYLPAGSTFTVLNTKTGAVVNGYSEQPLLRTNINGQDPISLEQLTTTGKPASYAVLADLPKGLYAVYSETNGKRSQAQEVEF